MASKPIPNGNNKAPRSFAFSDLLRFAIGFLALAISVQYYFNIDSTPLNALQNWYTAATSPSIDPTKIWTTLLSGGRGYLPGLLVLDDSIKKHRSKYALVVMVTEDLANDDGFMAVLKEAGIPSRRVDPIVINGVRIKGTWEKLAPWGFTEYDRVTMLDSDQIAMHNFDELMTMDLPSDRIAASHACTCNPRKLAHYPKDWVPETCGFTTTNKTTGLPAPITEESVRTQHLLNSGTVVLRPSKREYDILMHALETEPSVPDMIFYDQDLLALTHRGRWTPLPYIYNGLKTLRQCHADLWRDDKVKIVHYILAKPWKSRTIDSDIIGSTHAWWWNAFNDLEKRWMNKSADKVALWKEVVQPQLGN